MKRYRHYIDGAFADPAEGTWVRDPELLCWQAVGRNRETRLARRRLERRRVVIGHHDVEAVPSMCLERFAPPTARLCSGAERTMKGLARLSRSVCSRSDAASCTSSFSGTSIYLARLSGFVSHCRRQRAEAWMTRQPGLFDIDERLRRLSDIGDQLEAFAAVVDFEMFRPDLVAALN